MRYHKFSFDYVYILTQEYYYQLESGIKSKTVPSVSVRNLRGKGTTTLPSKTCKVILGKQSCT